jgi:hypothetical protein
MIKKRADLRPKIWHLSARSEKVADRSRLGDHNTMLLVLIVGACSLHRKRESVDLGSRSGRPGKGRHRDSHNQGKHFDLWGWAKGGESLHHWRHRPAPVAEVQIPAPMSRSGNWSNVRTLYHCTDRDSARSIMSNMQFKPGKPGMFGEGIYFAATPEQARAKAKIAGIEDGVTITADVFLGFVLEVPAARNSLTKEEVYEHGCHSVHGITDSGDDYVVFKPDSIQKIVGADGL